ncbi:hypothetical protein AVEN_237840-1 [Araneus ventricosus]|uniref:Uncharacterized protein n=1 Tax=Araneus ventricosus TaxID=182803 RepID=A0A4Y2LCB8_ARAVE|nr:hypothetical protein AVEN_237840-1 [Araneus ventricosus]
MVCLYIAWKQNEGYFETDLAILNRGQKARTTPSWHPLSRLPHHTSGTRLATTYDLARNTHRTTPAGRLLATTYDLARNRYHTKWIFRAIWLSTWNPLAPKLKPKHLTIAAAGQFGINGHFLTIRLCSFC